MIHEYAVSPILFSNQHDLMMLFQSFEAGSGRLISDFPRRKWIQYVRELIKKSVTDQVDQRAWMELLIKVQQHVLTERQGPIWDENKTWIENAIDENKRWQFWGILNDKATPSVPEVIPFGPSMHSNLRWKNPTTISVLRLGPEIVKCVAPLIDISTTLVLVDRNFIPSEARFLKVLSAFADLVNANARGQKITQIKYVTTYEKDRNTFQTPALFQQSCEQFLPSFIPIGIEVKFIIKIKALLHKRLVLTNVGAILVEHGLDEGSGQVLLARLSEEDFKMELSQWDKQPMHTFTIAGAKP